MLKCKIKCSGLEKKFDIHAAQDSTIKKNTLQTTNFSAPNVLPWIYFKKQAGQASTIPNTVDFH